MNRVELTTDGKDCYMKAVMDVVAIEQFFVWMYLKSRRRAPKKIIIDLDDSG